MAIAFDAASSGGVSGTSLTFSHTCTGSNLYLFVLVTTADQSTVTGVTYNGTAMSTTGAHDLRSGRGQIYYLANPASGTHNVVVSCNASNAIKAVSSSYTGVSSTGNPEATAFNSGFTSGTITTSVTTLTDNAWVVGFAMFDGTPTMQAGSGATERSNSGGSSQVPPIGLYDSNGPKTPAGSYSMSVSPVSGSGELDLRTYSIKPVAAAVVNGAGFLALM